MMVQQPTITVMATRADSWQFTGSLAAVAEQVVDRLGRRSGQPYHIEVTTTVPAHAGLGSGTQIALAVAAALSPPGESFNVTSIAHRLGRGQRSWVGTLGFAEGGLVVDLGSDESPRRLIFPESWPLWLAVPARGSNWSGEQEQRAFDRLAGVAGATRSIMLQWLTEALAPAVERGDWPLFSAALREYNRQAGRWFAAVQGGEFSEPRVADCVALLEAAGGAAGQSSWGPTVFAVLPPGSKETCAGLAAAVGRLGYRLLPTYARNAGYKVIE
jgi:beta-RFAP synthase